MTVEALTALSQKFSKELRPQQNYQFVMLKHILQNGQSSKADISKSLAKANGSNDIKFYRNCPVFKVLMTKNLVDKTVRGKECYYDLNHTIDLTNTERIELIKVLTSTKTRFDRN